MQKFNSLSQGGSNLANPSIKHVKPKPKEDPLDDAYKMLSWLVRTGAETLGYKFGDAEFDDNIGKAVSGFMPARILCKRDELTKMCVHALAGTWKAVK